MCLRSFFNLLARNWSGETLGGPKHIFFFLLLLFIYFVLLFIVLLFYLLLFCFWEGVGGSETKRGSEVFSLIPKEDKQILLI